MKIPEIRDRLHVLAVEHNLPELATLAEATRRRFGGRKAPIKQRSLDPSLGANIRGYAKANPKANYAEIARRYNVNIGRVSEALIGERE